MNQPIQLDTCPECGARVEGGRAGCTALHEELAYQQMSDVRIARVYRLAFDTYCMQHVETYCVSAKSYAAHLVGLCCGVERGGEPSVYDQINRWLNGNVPLTKPQVLTERGSMWITDVMAAQDVNERVQRIREWASNVWSAYATQHDIARDWMKQMMARKK